MSFCCCCCCPFPPIPCAVLYHRTPWGPHTATACPACRAGHRQARGGGRAGTHCSSRGREAGRLSHARTCVGCVGGMCVCVRWCVCARVCVKGGKAPPLQRVWSLRQGWALPTQKCKVQGSRRPPPHPPHPCLVTCTLAQAGPGPPFWVVVLQEVKHVAQRGEVAVGHRDACGVGVRGRGGGRHVQVTGEGVPGKCTRLRRGGMPDKGSGSKA